MLVNNENAIAFIKIRGVLVDLLLKLDSEFYGPFVTSYKKCDKVRIVKLPNGIYGTMVASLLYYKKFVNIVNKNGIKLNLYYPCAANIIANNKKQTIFFQVDDCKIIHQDSKMNEEFINILRNEYEGLFEDRSGKTKLRRGHIQEYLGMNLDYSMKGHLNFTMM